MFKTVSFLDFAVSETSCWCIVGMNIEMKDLKPGLYNNSPHFLNKYPAGNNLAGFRFLGQE